MWFDESMNDAWLVIDKGIRVAGYEPLRIDQKQHNNKIDDEIMAAIRRSKFVVADFTKQRGGVYFEAGFAKGLGLEVIWLCRKDEIDEVDFDTRQYSHIVWEADKLTELSAALKNRVEATIGHGTS
jgi:nucleoside 2-deoxyribosyltransferase